MPPNTPQHNLPGSISQKHGARRLLTVLFADLTNSTGLVGTMVSEDYADLIAGLNEIFNDVIPRHGGHVVQVRGDGVLAVFGLQAREDESRHAVEAALDLHTAVKRIPDPVAPGQFLSLHSGVHSGLVLMVEGGDVVGSYVLAGDAPHVASRLSDACGPDEILVSEDSLGSDRHFFQVSDLEYLDLRSLPGPLPAYRVTGRTGIDTRFEARRMHGLTALIGRDRDLGFLQSTYNAAGHRLQRVRVTGPAGMGKTRLVESFLQSVDTHEVVVLASHCERQPKEALLQPAMDMLRQLCVRVFNDQHQRAAEDVQQSMAEGLRQVADLAQLDEAQLASLSRALGQQSVDENQLLEALVAVLVSISERSRLALFFDDWHWADDASRAFYTRLAAHKDKPILMITSIRTGTPAVVDDGAVVLDLQPLSKEKMQEMITELLPAADPFLVSRIAHASGGNVLYLEELCHSVRYVSDVADAMPEQADAARLPNYLKMLVESRVAELPADQQQLLRCAAVVGNIVPRWLLSEITDIDVTDDVVEALSSKDLLFADESQQTLRFKHGLTRDVVVDEVGVHERRRLHGLIAETLALRHQGDSVNSIVAMLAYHYSEAAEFDKAADYAERAGDRAMDAAALDRARAHYQSALHALGETAASTATKTPQESEASTEHYRRWIAITQRLAMACLYDAQYDQLPIYQQALQLATSRQDHASATEAEYRLAYINYSLGEGPAAVRHCHAAVSMAQRLSSPAFSVQLKATLGQTMAINGRYAEAMPLLNDAIDEQRPFKNRSRIAPAYAYTLAARAMVAGDLGNFDDAYADFDEADELIGTSNHQIRVSTSSMRGGVYVWQGRWEDAMACAEQTVELANHIGSRYMYAIGVAMKGYCMWRLDMERGMGLLQQGIDALEQIDQGLWTSLHYSWHAQVIGELGDFARLRHAVASARARSRKGERLGDGLALTVLAVAPEEFRRHAPDHYFALARCSAEQRQSARESACIDLAQAQFLSLSSTGGEQALILAKSAEQFFTDHKMHWHAGHAQMLLNA